MACVLLQLLLMENRVLCLCVIQDCKKSLESITVLVPVSLKASQLMEIVAKNFMHEIGSFKLMNYQYDIGELLNPQAHNKKIHDYENETLQELGFEANKNYCFAVFSKEWPSASNKAEKESLPIHNSADEIQLEPSPLCSSRADKPNLFARDVCPSKDQVWTFKRSRKNFCQFVWKARLETQRSSCKDSSPIYESWLWPNGEVPYRISKKFKRSEKQLIKKSLEEINSRASKLRFRKRRRDEKDYIKVMHGDSFSSRVGRKGGEQPLILERKQTLSTAIIQHEFLHAAGFHHEHNRPDRDQYIEILWENIPEDEHFNYQKITYDGYGMLGPYDPYSVMHYLYLCKETKKPAFKFKQDDIDIDRVGNSRTITEIDIQKIDALYSYCFKFYSYCIVGE